MQSNSQQLIHCLPYKGIYRPERSVHNLFTVHIHKKCFALFLSACHRKIGPGKMGMAGPILDTETGLAALILVDQV